VGLNNLKNTEYVNVVVQMLSRVKQVREMGLFGAPKGLLSEKLAMLMKKMWNNRNFKGVVSPHEFIQALAEASQKKFRMGK
jgi:U4/U6.U5 tri-snRNP-associated protein 2